MNPLMIALGLGGLADLWGAQNQGNTNQNNFAAQQAHQQLMNSYVQQFLQPGQSPYSQAIMQFAGLGLPQQQQGFSNPFTPTQSQYNPYGPAGYNPFDPTQVPTGLIPSGPGTNQPYGTGGAPGGWSPGYTGLPGNWWETGGYIGGGGLDPNWWQTLGGGQIGINRTMGVQSGTPAGVTSPTAAPYTPPGASQQQVGGYTGALPGGYQFDAAGMAILPGGVPPTTSLYDAAQDPMASYRAELRGMTPEQRNTAYQQMVQQYQTDPTNFNADQWQLLYNVTGGGTGQIGYGSGAQPIPQAGIDFMLNPGAESYAAYNQLVQQNAGNNPSYAPPQGAPNYFQPTGSQAGGAVDNFQPGQLPGIPGGTGAGGDGQMFKYQPITPGMGIGTQGFNPGQDALMQMMKKDIGQPNYDQSLMPNLQSLGSGNSQFDNTELFKSFGALDDIALNKQADQLHASAGSLGQRFGTAMNRNEAEMRGNFAAQTRNRDALISAQSFEAAQGRRMPALGQMAQMGQFGGQQALGNAQLQMGAASNVAGNVQNMQQFNAQQGNIYNQLMMQAFGQAQGAQQGQNSYNAGLLGILNGVGIPQQQASPWPGAVGSVSQTAMMYPFLDKFLNSGSNGSAPSQPW